MTGEPTDHMPGPGAPWAPPRPPRSRTRTVVLVGVVVVALAAGAAGWFIRGDRRERAGTAAAPTSAAPASATTSTTSTADPLGGLLGGGLGELTNDPVRLAKCFGADIGALLGGAKHDIPTTDASSQYGALVKWVQHDRGLTFTHVPTPTYVTARQMARRVGAQVMHDFTPRTAALDQQLFVALGVAEPGTDLRREYAQFVGGQVAGYYDPASGAMVILGDPHRPLDANALTTVAHELEHALADQNLHLPRDSEATQAASSDGQLAATALVEGDATVTMTQFQFEETDIASLLSGGEGDISGQLQQLGDAPHFLADQLLFPYLEGLNFVCALRAGHGWPAVNRAYAKPPSTTAQIMFPERYTRGEAAQPVGSLGEPGTGWHEDRSQTFGAADLMFLFEAPGDDTNAALSDPMGRAAAWAGGIVTQWSKGSATATGISLVQRAGAAMSLCDSVAAWYAATLDVPAPTLTGRATRTFAFAAARGHQAAELQCAGNDVRVGIAPDAAAAAAIANTGSG